jgi:hypothetical protein
MGRGGWCIGVVVVYLLSVTGHFSLLSGIRGFVSDSLFGGFRVQGAIWFVIFHQTIISTSREMNKFIFA